MWSARGIHQGLDREIRSMSSKRLVAAALGLIDWQRRQGRSHQTHTVEAAIGAAVRHELGYRSLFETERSA